MELAPLEHAHISLSVRPLHPGMLTVEGLAWTLNDVATGFCPFPAKEPTPQRRSTGGARCCLVLLLSCSLCLSYVLQYPTCAAHATWGL